METKPVDEYTLVTGGAGYIGSFTARELLEEGHPVLILDNLSTGHIEVVHLLRAQFGDALVAFEKVDLLDPEALRDVAARYAVRGIVDFAARSLVGESQAQPRLYFENNVLGFLNLVTAFPRTPLVKSSTAATYGEPSKDEIPLTESYQDRAVERNLFPVSQLRDASIDFASLVAWYRAEVEAPAPWAAIDETDIAHLRIPTNVYGITKVMDELILEKRHGAWGSTSLSLRYFNAAGADPDGGMGEDHDPETHLIPLVMKTALRLRGELQLFGTDYPTRDGTCIRDYISVRDLADAHVRALRHLTDGGGSAALNLGQSLGYSVREILEKARDVTGCDIPVREGPRRAGDPATLVADAARAGELLGWRNEESLEDIISQAWAWHRSHPAGYAG